MPEIQCELPELLDFDRSRRLLAKVANEMPSLRKNPAAWNREAARQAGVDLQTWLAIRNGKLASTRGSMVPSPKSPVGKVKPQKPVRIIAEKPIPVPEVVDVAPSNIEFDWENNTRLIKEAKAKKAAEDTLDIIGKVTGKKALANVDVDISSKGLPKGAVGQHYGNVTQLHPELLTKKFAEEAARMQKSGFWAPTKNLTPTQSTMVHEIGHDLMEKYLTPQLTQQALSGLAKEIGSPLSLGNEHVVANWLKKNKDAIGKKVSRYGAQEPHELYAEMWVMYIDDPLGCPPFIKHFGDTIVAKLRRL